MLADVTSRRAPYERSSRELWSKFRTCPIVGAGGGAGGGVSRRAETGAAGAAGAVRGGGGALS
ncbi:MAG TPA: hypothetical protein PLG60_04800, partial [Acidimicrobiales bacterium]|nr:hypothetical protein [Acidimicrobiales bacterium]